MGDNQIDWMVLMAGDEGMKRPQVLGLLTARGGSKGLPRKNVLPIGGKPLLAWSIEAAKGSASVDRVVMSTDDDEIAGISREFGADVPFMRPEHLSRDDSAHFPVVEHAIQWLEKNEGYRPDYILLLQPTSPLRTAGDIDGAVGLAVRHRADAVVSVTELDKSHHPYLAYRLAANGTLSQRAHCGMRWPNPPG